MDRVRCGRMEVIEWSRMESDGVLVFELSGSQHATLFVYGVHVEVHWSPSSPPRIALLLHPHCSRR